MYSGRKKLSIKSVKAKRYSFFMIGFTQLIPIIATCTWLRIIYSCILVLFQLATILTAMFC